MFYLLLLLCRSIPLPGNPLLNLLRDILQVDQHALLLRMALLQAELLDADLARSELVLAEDDGERDAVRLCLAELLGEFGLDFIREFRLHHPVSLMG